MPEATAERLNSFSPQAPVEDVEDLRPMKGWHCTHTIGGVQVLKVVEPDPHPNFPARVVTRFYDEYGRQVGTRKGYPAIPAELDTRAFRTRDIAAAVYACLAPFNGSPWIIDVNFNEAEFKGMDPDGNFLIQARIYDRSIGSHEKVLIRIPKELEFEIIRDRSEIQEV